LPYRKNHVVRASISRSLFVTTPLSIKRGWLCCKEFDKTMKRSTSYRIELGLLMSWVCSWAGFAHELGLLSGRHKLTAYQFFATL